MSSPRVLSRLLLTALLLLSGAAAALTELEEGELAGIAAREGIAILFDFRINADANGDPLPSLSNCAGLSNPCSLALKFNNRNSGSGEWLKLKDTWGRLYLNGLRLDFLPNPGTASSYDNPVRFQNESGTCLLASCEASGVAALGMSFAGSYTAFEEDVLLKLNVGRVAIEYGASGYGNDANGGFLGVRVRDDAVVGNSAAIDVDGSVRLYGF